MLQLLPTSHAEINVTVTHLKNGLREDRSEVKPANGG
jgi:hypothetical protein